MEDMEALRLAAKAKPWDAYPKGNDPLILVLSREVVRLRDELDKVKEQALTPPPERDHGSAPH